MTAMLRGYPVGVGDTLILWSANGNRNAAERPRVTVTKIGRTRVHVRGRGSWEVYSARMEDGNVDDWSHLRTEQEERDVAERLRLWADLEGYGMTYGRYNPSTKVPLDTMRQIVGLLDGTHVAVSTEDARHLLNLTDCIDDLGDNEDEAVRRVRSILAVLE